MRSRGAIRYLRARRAIDNVIGSVAFDLLKKRAASGRARRADPRELPAAHAEAGLLVVDLFDLPGMIFAGEKMEQWSVFGPKRHFTIANPLPLLFDRVAAVRALAGDVRVDGRIVFSMRGEFPKGRPDAVMRLDDLQDVFPVVDKSPGAVAAAFAPVWEHIKSVRTAESARELIESPESRTRSRCVDQAARRGRPARATRTPSLDAPCRCAGIRSDRARSSADPSTPVTRNCTPGNRSPSMPMNGMLPPGPHVHRVAAKELLRCALCRGFEPRLQWRRVPAGRCRFDSRKSPSRRRADRSSARARAPPSRLRPTTVGGRRNDNFRVVYGRSTLPDWSSAGTPSMPTTLNVGRHVRVQQQLERVVRQRRAFRPASGTCLRPCRRARAAAPAACLRRSGGIAVLSSSTSMRAGARVLDAREQSARDPEARRHDAARRARVHAFGSARRRAASPTRLPRSEVVHQSWS